jgi:Kef-type K+ transport system membrane component KefB
VVTSVSRSIVVVMLDVGFASMLLLSVLLGRGGPVQAVCGVILVLLGALLLWWTIGRWWGRR